MAVLSWNGVLSKKILFAVTVGALIAMFAVFSYVENQLTDSQHAKHEANGDGAHASFLQFKSLFSLVETIPQWTKRTAQACLKNRTIVFFGDSTMEESIYDIIILLSGVTDFSTIHDFLNEAIRMPRPGESISFATLGEVSVEFRPNHRVLVATVPSKGITLRHRFIGLCDIFGPNPVGISSFLEPECKNLSEEYSRGADLLVLNSFYHDISNPSVNPGDPTVIANFERTLENVITDWRTRDVPVVYRGPNVLANGAILAKTSEAVANASLHYYTVAKAVCARMNVPYVDFEPVLQAFWDTGLCANGGCLNIVHIGAIGYAWDGAPSMAMSTATSMYLMQSMCETLKST